MKKWLLGLAFVLLPLATAQVAYIYGFDHGSGTSLCVVGYAIDGKEALTELESCKDAEKASKSVFRHGLILYRELTNDAVHFDSENKVIM